MKRLTIVSIVGARPNFVKLAALSPEIRKVAREYILHTGQHYDYELSQQFFEELNIPRPNSHLGIVADTHGKQTGEMICAIESSILLNHPDAVIVYGDTNSTLAGALATTKLHIPLIHIEAGLRSFDRGMPEETNRVVVDHISDMLFCPASNAAHNLVAEGISPGCIYTCGDVMVDLMGLTSKKELRTKEFTDYYLLTIHREENDNLDKLKEIFKGLSGIKEDIVFPCHPRIRKYITSLRLPKNIQVISPVGYFEMQDLEKRAIRVITDSGGVQKEAYLNKVPCITLRKDTEWIETLTGKWNILTMGNSDNIQKALRTEPEQTLYNPYVYGKPGVSARIVSVIEKEITRRRG